MCQGKRLPSKMEKKKKCLCPAWGNLHIGVLNGGSFYSINWRFLAAGGGVSFYFVKESVRVVKWPGWKWIILRIFFPKL